MYSAAEKPASSTFSGWFSAIRDAGVGAGGPYRASPLHKHIAHGALPKVIGTSCVSGAKLQTSSARDPEMSRRSVTSHRFSASHRESRSRVIAQPATAD